MHIITQSPVCVLIHREVVDLILAKGFDINVKTLRGSALHEAALCGKIEVVKSLLDNGINVEIRDDSDKTVLEVMDELKTQRTREVIHIILGDLFSLSLEQKAFQFFWGASKLSVGVIWRFLF